MYSSLRKSADSRPPAAAKRSPAVTELDGNAMFEAFVCEFHWTALQVGAVAQLFNASLQNGQKWMLRTCRNILPVEAAIVGFATKNWKELSVSQNMAKNISRVFFNLADAKNKTEIMLDRFSSFNSVIPSPGLEQLTALWRKLAEDCLTLVNELEPDTRWRLNSLYTENALVLSKFVKAAVNGGAANVDASGHVALPVLPQRRREPRFTLLQPCNILIRNQSLPAVARDISRNGLGISCRAELPLREQVVVELKGGRKFRGRIVWIREGNQGIQFDDPLALTDPLLGSGIR